MDRSGQSTSEQLFAYSDERQFPYFNVLMCYVPLHNVSVISDISDVHDVSDISDVSDIMSMFSTSRHLDPMTSCFSLISPILGDDQPSTLHVGG